MSIQLAKELYIPQGTTFRYSMRLTDELGNPLNLGGYSLAGSMKTSYNNTLPDANFNFSYVSSSNGQVDMILPASTSQALAYQTYYYDVMLTNTSSLQIDRIQYGIAYLSRQTTQL